MHGPAPTFRTADDIGGGLVRILIADDDDIAVEILEHALAQFGYHVTVARDGREALDLVRSGQFRMVISDWEMPKMTGIELCQEIRRRSASGYVYVILLTSRHGTQSVVDGMNAGADDFINKPFQPQELVGADSRRRADSFPGKPGADHLQHGETRRIPRSGNRRRTWSGCGNTAG